MQSSYTEYCVGMSHLAEFRNEYHIASRMQSTRHFSDILSQHALVMIDAALPDLKRHNYVALGTRLAKVQANWIDLLCSGLDCMHQTELDKQYRRLATMVIEAFTQNLMEMLIDEKVVRYNELACVEKFHTSCLKHHHRELKLKFLAYVNSLYDIYQSKNPDEYYKTAVRCLAIAHALGVFLDETIFE